MPPFYFTSPHRTRTSLPSFLILMLLGIATGCARHDIPKAELIFHRQDFNVKVRDDAYQGKLALLPVRDERPVLEKEGDSPGAVYLLVWNARVGDYVTGNDAIEGDLTERVRESLKSSFDKANLFRDVEAIIMKSDIADSPLATELFMAQSGADYVLEVTITHAFAKQHQNSRVGILPAWYVNAVSYVDEMGAPTAACELYLKLYDGKSGRLAWSEKIHAIAGPGEKPDMAEALKSAVRRAVEKATDALYDITVYPAAGR